MDIITQINKNLDTTKLPERIISLVPSITELLFYLGLGEKIVGVTNFCKYPKNEIKNVSKIGGTKNIDFNKIELLKPDLIISIKEENSKNDIVVLSKNYNVFIGDLYNYKSALDLIIEIGNICRVELKAKKLIKEIDANFNKLDLIENKTCCYLIWNNPIMTVGDNTFINSMLQKAGFENIFSNFNSYPVITENDILNKNPKFILLSSEPFKFTEKHQKIYQEKYPNSKVILVDGEMFSWYGSRMLYAPKYFNSILK